MTMQKPPRPAVMIVSVGRIKTTGSHGIHTDRSTSSLVHRTITRRIEITPIDIRRVTNQVDDGNGRRSLSKRSWEGIRYPC